MECIRSAFNSLGQTREEKIVYGGLIVTHLAVIAIGLLFVASKTLNFQAIQQAGQNLFAPVAKMIAG